MAAASLCELLGNSIGMTARTSRVKRMVSSTQFVRPTFLIAAGTTQCGALDMDMCPKAFGVAVIDDLLCFGEPRFNVDACRHPMQ